MADRVTANPTLQTVLGTVLTLFLLQVAGFALLYAVALLATLPFLVYFGKPKRWQKVAEFLLSFPLDNERLGFFSFASAIVVVFLNGLLWGIAVLGTCRLVEMIISSIKSYH